MFELENRDKTLVSGAGFYYSSGDLVLCTTSRRAKKLDLNE